MLSKNNYGLEKLFSNYRIGFGGSNTSFHYQTSDCFAQLSIIADTLIPRLGCMTAESSMVTFKRHGYGAWHLLRRLQLAAVVWYVSSSMESSQSKTSITRCNIGKHISSLVIFYLFIHTFTKNSSDTVSWIWKYQCLLIIEKLLDVWIKGEKWENHYQTRACRITDVQ